MQLIEIKIFLKNQKQVLSISRTEKAKNGIIL